MEDEVIWDDEEEAVNVAAHVRPSSTFNRAGKQPQHANHTSQRRYTDYPARAYRSNLSACPATALAATTVARQG
jgi:hypothetical protein